MSDATKNYEHIIIFKDVDNNYHHIAVKLLQREILLDDMYLIVIPENIDLTIPNTFTFSSLKFTTSQELLNEFEVFGKRMYSTPFKNGIKNII